ncbi:MAG: hypothetical protein ACK4YP_27300 [Myxococcota bacterium]
MWLLLACADEPAAPVRWAHGPDVAVANEVVLVPYYAVRDTLHIYDVRAEIPGCTVTEGDPVVLEGPCAWNDRTWTGRAEVSLVGDAAEVTLDGWGWEGSNGWQQRFLDAPVEGVPELVFSGSFHVEGWEPGDRDGWAATLDGELAVGLEGRWRDECVREPGEPMDVSAAWTVSSYRAENAGTLHDSTITGEVSASTVGAYTFAQESEKERCDAKPQEARIDVADGADTVTSRLAGCAWDWEWRTSAGLVGRFCI